MKKLLFILMVSFSAFSLNAQVTTSSIIGSVNDVAGTELIGATVQATHIPSGTVYGVVTQESGRFIIPNMRVGGPYSVEVSYLGFATQTEDNVFLTLGQRFQQDFNLREEGVTADEVLILGVSDAILNGERTGPATSVTREQLDNLPTISRSASDYTRLNTMSAEGGSCQFLWMLSNK